MSDDDDFNEPFQGDDDDNDMVEDFTENDDANGKEEKQAVASSTSSSSASSSHDSLAHLESSTHDYRILDESTLQIRFQKFISEVSSLLSLSARQVSAMLRYYNWNSERLMGKYADSVDEVMKTCGLQNYSDDLLEKRAKETVGTIDCRICDERTPKSSAFALGCQHWFCDDCWRSFCTDKVDAGKSCLQSRCPAYKCLEAVNDVVFQKFLSASHYAKYNSFLLRSFVDDNRSMRWCPQPRCNHIIEAIQRAVLAVRCQCKNSFCFQCMEEVHSPVTCPQLTKWNLKCKSESENAHWIIANTRKCPRCHVRIEKNQGCNHMTCKSCKHEFCWVCSQPWSEHGSETGGFYKCNKFDPKTATKKVRENDSQLSADEAQAETNRYLFYYQRFHTHDQSKKFAERQRIATEQRMLKLHETQTAQASQAAAKTASSSLSSTTSSSATSSATAASLAWIDVQYLSEATNAVFECRQVLKYTYVFAYYLPEGSEKTLFEYLQQKLEQSTEKLSEMSELPIDRQDRIQITNYTRVTKQFMKNLLDGVEKGLTQT